MKNLALNSLIKKFWINTLYTVQDKILEGENFEYGKFYTIHQNFLVH